MFLCFYDGFKLFYSSFEIIIAKIGKRISKFLYYFHLGFKFLQTCIWVYYEIFVIWIHIMCV